MVIINRNLLVARVITFNRKIFPSLFYEEIRKSWLLRSIEKEIGRKFFVFTKI